MGVRTAEEAADWEELMAFQAYLQTLPPELAAALKEQASQAMGL
jgi:hypothetical protein